MARRRVAGVGAGHFARFHVEAWSALAGAEVVAWCDQDPVKAGTLAATFGIGQTFSDFQTMLDAVDPDVVDIVTPAATHLALATLALDRGIPVICQKPLAPSWGECVALAQRAQASGVACVVHENFRFQPWCREMRRLLDAQHFGRLHAVAFRFRPGDGQGPHAYLDRQPYFRDMPRFLMMETGIHFIDIFRFLMGEVAAVTARLRRVNPNIAGEDAGYVIFEFAGGATGLLDASRANGHAARDPRHTGGQMWLEGERGVMHLDGDAKLWWQPHQGAVVEHPYDRGPTSPRGDSVVALQQHVLAHLAGGHPVENGVQDYLQNVRIQEAIYASHAEGRCIVLDRFEPAPGSPPPALATR